MAEIINIQHSKGQPRRFWSFGAIAAAGVIVVGLLAWLLFIAYDRDDKLASGEKAAATATAGKAADVSRKVEGFVSFVRDNRAEEKMNLQHDYASDGIRRLAFALGALAERDKVADQNLEQRLDMLWQHADRLQEDWRSTEHADTIRDAFTLAAETMAALPAERYPDFKNHVAQVRRAAEAINPDQLALEQKAQVREFFNRTSDALQAMSQAGS